MINILRIRQALVETARKLDEATMFEQGAGLFDLDSAFEYFKNLARPKVSIFPSFLNMTDEEPYTYPYSLQPLYSTGMPTILNLTVINSVGPKTKVSKIEFHSKSTSKDFINVRDFALRKLIFSFLRLVMRARLKFSLILDILLLY